MIKIEKINLESVFLLVLFSVLVWAGYALLFDYRMAHEFPYGYLASDAFQHQARAESIKQMGNYKYEAFYNSGGFKDDVGFYQPILYHIGLIFSNSAGLETYDGVYLLLFLLSSFAVLIMYLLIRKFNKNVAIISIPVSLLIFSFSPYIGFTWGHWPSIASQFFLIGFAWALSEEDIEKSYLLMSVMFMGIVLTHTSEAIFAIIFLFIYLGLKLIKRKINYNYTKGIILAFILSLIICFYYLIIFKFTWWQFQGTAFNEPFAIWEGNNGFYIAYFKILLIPLIVGAIFVLLHKKRFSTLSIFVFSMLLLGFSNYIGFGSYRPFQLRFFWPIYLSFFIGYGIFLLFKIFIPKWKEYYSIIIGLLLIVMLNIPSLTWFPKTQGISTQSINNNYHSGLMDKFHWESLIWFRENTPLDSNILFLYGDIYSQDAMLRNTYRTHYTINRKDYIGALENKTIKRNYKMRLSGAAIGDSNGAYRKGLFSYGYHTQETGIDFYFSSKDICSFDYYVFDKVSQQPLLAQYNMIIANELSKKDWIKLVYNNEYVVILKNNKPSEDCINETRISQ